MTAARSRERAWEDVLGPLMTEFDARAHELSLVMLERMRVQLPELLTDEDAAEGNRASTEASVREVSRALAAGADPRALELPAATTAYARDCARRGVPFISLVRSYRIAHSEFWKLLVPELTHRSCDEEQLGAAVEICSEWLFAYIDAATLLADRIYAREREQFARSAAAVRSEMIAALLSGAPLDVRDAELRLRHPLTRTHIGLCAWLDERPDDVDALILLERAVGDLASALGDRPPLIYPLGLLATAAWISGDPPLDVDALATRVVDTAAFPGVRFAVGEPATGPAGFRATHTDALDARRIANLAGAPEGSVTRYRDIAVAALACTDTERVRAFVARELGPLAGDDDTTLRLVETLGTYLSVHTSRGRAAHALGVHENTVTYRVRQAEEILGRSLETDTLNLRVALALAPLCR